MNSMNSTEGTSKDQRRDRGDLIVAAHRRVVEQQRQGRDLRHADEEGAGELVERFEKHEDAARNDAGRGQGSVTVKKALSGDAPILRAASSGPCRRQQRRGRYPDRIDEAMRGMDEDGGEDGAVDADIVEDAGDVDVDRDGRKACGSRKSTMKKARAGSFNRASA